MGVPSLQAASAVARKVHLDCMLRGFAARWSRLSNQARALALDRRLIRQANVQGAHTAMKKRSSADGGVSVESWPIVLDNAEHVIAAVAALVQPPRQTLRIAPAGDEPGAAYGLCHGDKRWRMHRTGLGRNAKSHQA